MQSGYIKLWRKSIDSGMIQNHQLWVFWTWCLMKATHQPIKQNIGFQEIHLSPGQFIFGRKSASSQTGISEQTIRTCLKNLEKSKNLTIKVTNKFSIITIVNWDSYQCEDLKPTSKSTSNQPATNQQLTSKSNCIYSKKSTKKNVSNKNDTQINHKQEEQEEQENNILSKESIRAIPPKKFIPPTIEEVIQFFTEKNFPVQLAQKAFEYYSVADWKDGKGNQVKNWKQKMIAVWMKEENRNQNQPVRFASKAHNEMMETTDALSRFLNRERA